MAIIDESRLDPFVKEPQPGTTAFGERAARRRAQFQGTPLPQTAAPHPLLAKGVLPGLGVGLPALGGVLGALGGPAAPITVPQGIAAGGVLGATLAESLRASLAPETSSPASAALNIGLQAIPFGGQAAKFVTPLAEKEIAALVPAVSKQALTERAIGLAGRITHAAETFKAVPTEIKDVINGIVNEASLGAPKIEIEPLLAALKDKAPILNPESFKNIMQAIEEAAQPSLGGGGGPLAISSPELLGILRKARNEAFGTVQKKAIDLVKGDINAAIADNIRRSHLGEQAAITFLKRTKELGTKLEIAENAVKEFSKNPLTAIKNSVANLNSESLLKALDNLTGNNFASEARMIVSELRALPRRAASNAEAIKKLAVLKNRARNIVKGVTIVLASTAGAKFGGIGALTGLFSGIAATRGVGPIAGEKLIGNVARGVASKSAQIAGQAGAGLAGNTLLRRLFESGPPSPPVEEETP